MTTPRSFSWAGENFLLDGKPFLIRSGEMHYARIPRPYWRDRLLKAKAMGLNTICTYVFWNAHEATPGKFDFTGQNDVAAFVKEAQKVGLWVLVRPGPYVCSEWEWGGFPWWLANIPGMSVRSLNQPFLKRTELYLNAVGKQLTPLLIENGGPIIMAQVENEYGSFGSDHLYMSVIRDQIKAAGFTGQLFTSDGPGMGMLRGGTLPDCVSVCNFGGGPKGAFSEFAKFRKNVPKMCGEFWAGWFDHWGNDHAKTSAKSQTDDLAWMIDNNVSFSIYMLHGGTTFGYMNGANWTGEGYRPDVTNYDYDSAIDEAGRLTPKWKMMRDMILSKCPDAEKTEPPAPLPMISMPVFRLEKSGSLFNRLPRPTVSERPMSFEALGIGYGFVLYRTTIDSATEGDLELGNLQDRAIVYVNGKQAGIVERRLQQTKLPISIPAGGTLDILVENQGRINFGRQLVSEKKGVESVSLAGKLVTGWQNYALPIASPIQSSNSDSYGPTFFRHRLSLTAVGDTYFDMSAWTKGVVWVNGHNLGRYWKIGAQQALFVPGCWLKKGANEVVVLELEDAGKAAISGGTEAIWRRE